MIEKFIKDEYIMHRYENNPLITKEMFPKKVKSVFNCGQAMYQGKYVLLISCIFEEEGQIKTEIHAAFSEDGIHFDIDKEPLCKDTNWAPDVPGDYDCWVIDPRVTQIGDEYYIVRPAQVRYPLGRDIGPAAILEKTKDFKTVEFVECIGLPINRVPCLFPEKINGEYVRLDRPYGIPRLTNMPEAFMYDALTYGMWISYSPDMIYWGRHRPFFNPCQDFANYKIGPTPPIKTKDGWLEIYHAVYCENGEYVYSLSAMLMDLNDPSKILYVLDRPILAPSTDYELYGNSDNTCFACGALADEEKDEIRIYYGAADERIALATGKLSELLDELKKHPLSDIECYKNMNK